MKKKGEERRTQILKAFEKQKTRLACNADLGPAVALGAPRSGFLADFQPPGASNSPLLGSRARKHAESIHKNT
jgi:hypothetical protein